MWKKNSVDPDQLASSEASNYRYILLSKKVQTFEKSYAHRVLIRSNMA